MNFAKSPMKKVSIASVLFLLLFSLSFSALSSNLEGGQTIPIVSASNGALPPPSLVLSSQNGYVGESLTASGSGYSASTTASYSMCFSQYYNYYCYGFGSGFVPTDSGGNLGTGSGSTIFTVPQTSSGSYYVQVVSATCCTILAQTGFGVNSIGLAISPTSGAQGQTITVSTDSNPDGLTPNGYYFVCFSTSSTSCSGASVAVKATGSGALPSATTVSVPDSSFQGNYYVDLYPNGGSIIASVPFVVTPESVLTLSTINGHVGEAITVAGSGYQPSTTSSYSMCFSLYYNYYCYGFGSSYVPTDSSGDLGAGTGSASFNIPQTPSGSYYVQIVTSVCCTVLAQAGFDVNPTGLSITPTTGAEGQSIAVSTDSNPNGLSAGTTYEICFSAYSTSCSGAFVPEVATASGALPAGATVSVPDSSFQGNYYVDLYPNGGSIIASVPFVVTPETLVLTPNAGSSGTLIGLSGSGYAPSTTSSYSVCFSQYYNYYCYGFTPGYISTDSSGNIASGSTVTEPATNGNFVQIVSSICCNILAQAAFSSPAPTTLSSPSNGYVGQSILISGSGYTASTTSTYSVCLSRTYNSYCNGFSPAFVSTDANGNLGSADGYSFTVPQTSSGAYFVEIVAPSCCTIYAQSGFDVNSIGLSISPAFVNEGQAITVSSTSIPNGLTPNSIYFLCFSSSSTSCNGGNGWSVSSVPLTTDASGTIPIGTLVSVPDLAAQNSQGNYWVDLYPNGGGVIASAFLDLSPQTLSIYSNNGIVGQQILLTGSNYTPSTTSSYSICFSQNFNSYCNGFSPSFIQTNATGNLGPGPGPTSFTIPQTASGAYFIQIVSPSCCNIFAEAGFDVNPMGLSISPPTGTEGQVIAVSSGGLTPGGTYDVCFSSSYNSCNGGNGWSVSNIPFTATEAGTIPTSVTVSVPDLAAQNVQGNYWVDLHPSSGGVIASALFVEGPQIEALAPSEGGLATMIAVTASGFAPTTSNVYSICFSQYFNSYCNGFSPSYVGTDGSGGISAVVAVPNSAYGTVYVQIVAPICCDVLSQSPFNVPTSISVSPGDGIIGTQVQVQGVGFAHSATITLNWDAPSGQLGTVQSTSSGAFTITITVPQSSGMGAHTITASDTSGDSATAQFSVDAVTTITSGSGSTTTTITETSTTTSSFTSTSTLTSTSTVTSISTTTSTTTVTKSSTSTSSSSRTASIPFSGAFVGTWLPDPSLSCPPQCTSVNPFGSAGTYNYLGSSIFSGSAQSNWNAYGTPRICAAVTAEGTITSPDGANLQITVSAVQCQIFQGSTYTGQNSLIGSFKITDPSNKLGITGSGIIGAKIDVNSHDFTGNLLGKLSIPIPTPPG